MLDRPADASSSSIGDAWAGELGQHMPRRQNCAASVTQGRVNETSSVAAAKSATPAGSLDAQPPNSPEARTRAGEETTSGTGSGGFGSDCGSGPCKEPVTMGIPWDPTGRRSAPSGRCAPPQLVRAAAQKPPGDGMRAPPGESRNGKGNPKSRSNHPL